MKVDRGEAQATGLAVLLHVALVAALTTKLAQTPVTPEPPAMAVEFVDSEDVALSAAAPSPAAAAAEDARFTPPEPARSTAPELPAAPALPTPVMRPLSPPAAASPERTVRPAASTARPAPPRPAPARPASARKSLVGDDFLADLPNAPAATRASPGAATFGAAAKASVDNAIKRQIQPCADRQNELGPGADRIRVVVNLRLDRSGRLSRPPVLVRTSGVDEDNARFEDLAYNQAVAVFRACAPLRLPPELYSTPQGGWGNITMTYRAK